MEHRDTATLETFLPQILDSPSDGGRIEMIVRRPDIDEREIVASAEVEIAVGLVGDNWLARGSGSTPDGSADPRAQLTLMNSRVAAAVAGSRDRWPLAGDQIYVDLDLSVDNLPAGTRLNLGSAVIEVSEKPHTGCPKFAGRFGLQALRFVNVGEGKVRRFRGMNATVVTPGSFAVGDTVTRT